MKPSIRSRILESASTKSLNLPGPGTYDPGIAKPRAPAYKLGTEKKSKETIVGKEVPGPGSYEPNFKVSKGNLPKWR